MALQTINISSTSLQRMVEIAVYLPNTPLPAQGYPSLTLLHGLTGNMRSWTNNTNILQLADQYGIAIIMPSGENSFYLNQGPHQKYSDFVGFEVLQHVRDIFPISKRRSDTYIGGLSMGGYGALLNGLKYKNHYSAILAFSNALLVDHLPNIVNYSFDLLQNELYLEQVFGKLDQIISSPANYKNYLSHSSYENLPNLYISCGQSDMFIDLNRELSEYLKLSNIDHTYVEIEGDHNWETWQTMIENALTWLKKIN